MFNWLTRLTRRNASPRPRFVQPTLEGLEVRDVPSTITLNATYGAQNNVTFSGDVTDTPSPGGQTVMLVGRVMSTTTTDANGHYSITLQPSALGDVRAWTMDGQSNTAQVTLAATPPKITDFNAVLGAGNYWTFSGDLTASNPDGLTMYFGGISSLMGQAATCDADGHFSLTVALNGTQYDNGTAEVSTRDWWGQQSNTAEALVDQPGAGDVTSSDPNGMTMNTVVALNGTQPANGTGAVGTTDSWFQQSNIPGSPMYQSGLAGLTSSDPNGMTMNTNVALNGTQYDSGTAAPTDLWFQQSSMPADPLTQPAV